jgi:hypothetical protein
MLRTRLDWVPDVKLINPGLFSVRFELLERLTPDFAQTDSLASAVASLAFEESLQTLVGLASSGPIGTKATLDKSLSSLSAGVATRFHVSLINAKQELDKIQSVLNLEVDTFFGSFGTLQVNGVIGGGVKISAEASQTPSTASLIPSSRAFSVSHSGSEFIRVDFATPFDPWREIDPRQSFIISEIALVLQVVKIKFEHFLFISPGTVDSLAWLGLETEFVAHDFYLLCPSPHLLDEKLNFCHGKCTSGKGACQTVSLITKQDTFSELKNKDVHVWRSMWGSRTRKLSRVTFFSRFTARQFMDVYPDVESYVMDSQPIRSKFSNQFPGFDGENMRVVLAGDIGPHKGALLLRDLGPALERIGVDLTVLGRVWIGAGRSSVKSVAYEGPENLKGLLENIKPHLALIPSRGPETYSLVLSEMWESGIPVLASRIGALEERISQHGGGFLVDNFTQPHDWLLAVQRIKASPETLVAAHQQIANRYIGTPD